MSITINPQVRKLIQTTSRKIQIFAERNEKEKTITSTSHGPKEHKNKVQKQRIKFAERVKSNKDTDHGMRAARTHRSGSTTYYTEKLKLKSLQGVPFFYSCPWPLAMALLYRPCQDINLCLSPDTHSSSLSDANDPNSSLFRLEWKGVIPSSLKR